MGKLPDKLAPFIPGDDNRTAFSADVLNEIVDAINPFLNMKGAGGIKVIKSDANIVIAYTGLTGSGATGSVVIDGGSGSVYNCIARWA